MSRTRRWLRRLTVLTLAGALVLGGVAIESRRETGTIRLADLDIVAPRLTGELRVLQVTDTHDMSRDRWSQVIAHARATRPDLVALTGDVVNAFSRETTRLDEFAAALAELDLPVYFVQGNHDHAGGLLDQVVATLQRHGITVLANTHTSLDGRWGQLDLVGTTDYYASAGDLAQAMRGTRPEATQLVLTHDPGIVRDLPGSGAELAICGHTHGGQVRLPWVGALYAPGQGFLPHYDAGLFQVGDSQLYIDRGAGQSAPLRLLDPAQVTLITLHP